MSWLLGALDIILVGALGALGVLVVTLNADAQLRAVLAWGRAGWEYAETLEDQRDAPQPDPLPATLAAHHVVDRPMVGRGAVR